MRRWLNIAFSGFLLLSTMAGQVAPNAVLGRWKGQSTCTVKPSPCHDETVVYDISASAQKPDVIIWKADKIANGEQQNMGTLDCRYSTPTRTLTCDLPGKGIWKLTVRGNSMTGTLELADGTLFRRVSVKRVR